MVFFWVSSKLQRNWKTQPCVTAPRSQWYSQFCPKRSSIRMARLKTWPEGVAERRGRKTCLPESQDFFEWWSVQLGVVDRVRKLWKQLNPVDCSRVLWRGYGADPLPCELGEKVCINTVQQHRPLELHQWQACQRGLRHVSGTVHWYGCGTGTGRPRQYYDTSGACHEGSPLWTASLW